MEEIIKVIEKRNEVGKKLGIKEHSTDPFEYMLQRMAEKEALLPEEESN